MSTLPAVVDEGFGHLGGDTDLWQAIEHEHRRQAERLVLVASSSVAHPSVLAALTATAVNVTAEGYPGRRYHAGCSGVDRIEDLAVRRACSVFGARYANVQPHSATTANQTVMSSLLRPGDTVLGMGLDYGGHLTHGSKASFSGQYFHAVGYGLAADGLIDYDQVTRLAHEHRPRLIICGATAYSRTIDFARFRAIADEVGAYLLADISHTAGLVAAGLHPSPIDHAHVTTTCTHKQLFGPRGGLILMGRDADGPAPGGKRTLREHFQRAVFPFVQGAPVMNTIAAKAAALGRAATPEFVGVMNGIVRNAAALADSFDLLGYPVVSGGTDNHIVLLDLTRYGLTGLATEEALEDGHVIVNKNRVPGDTKPALVTSGIRLGTNTVAYRGMGPREMAECASLFDEVVVALRRTGGELPAAVRDRSQRRVSRLCEAFPLPDYGTPAERAYDVTEEALAS
jgi:glycine hydroxymethyltransferase